MNRRAFFIKSLPAVPVVLLGASDLEACWRRRRQCAFPCIGELPAALVVDGRYTAEFGSGWSSGIIVTPNHNHVWVYTAFAKAGTGITDFRVEAWRDGGFLGHTYARGFDVTNVATVETTLAAGGLEFEVVAFAQHGMSHEGSPQMRLSGQSGHPFQGNTKKMYFKLDKREVEVWLQCRP